MMFSGSTDSIKCVLVAKPTRSQALCSHFLRKHSCFCSACIVTRKHQSELKHQQGAQRKWLVDAFSWPNAALMWCPAAAGSNGCCTWVEIQFLKANLNHILPEEPRDIKRLLADVLYVSDAQPWEPKAPAHQVISPCSLSDSNFCILPTAVPEPPAPAIHVNQWLISEALRGGGGQSQPLRLWLDKQWCLTGLTDRVSHRKTYRDWSIK